MPVNALAPAAANALAQPYFGNPNIAAQGAKARAARGGYATPEQAEDVAKTALGFTPVIGDLLSGYDAMQAAREGNYGDAMLMGLGLLPLVPSLSAGSKVADKVVASSTLFDPRAVQSAVKQANDPKAKETLAFVRPQDFLALSAPLERPNKEKLDSIRQAIQTNTPLRDIPYLEMRVSKDQSRARVTGHEGRHRAMVLMEQGIEYMPVRVVPSEYIGSFSQYGYGTRRPEYSLMRNESIVRLPAKVRQEGAPENFLYNPFIATDAPINQLIMKK